MPAIDRLVITVNRDQTWAAQVFVEGKRLGSRLGQTNDEFIETGGTRAGAVDLYRTCSELGRTLYIGAFRNAVNIGSNENYYDIQIGQLFISRWKAYKTGVNISQNEAAHRVEETIARMFNFRKFQINASDDAQTLQLFIDGKSFKLHELGSGLTQFILVLANAAVQQPAYILIDEPEINSHPSLQLDFLTALGSFAQNGVLFATHSIGLARAAADSIYSLTRNADGTSSVQLLEVTPRLSELLGELSFSGYRDLGVDKVLLVEGSSDVRTIQQFLRLYSKEHLVVLVPLGGAGLIKEDSDAQLEEIKRLSNNVLALIDSERSGPKPGY